LGSFAGGDADEHLEPLKIDIVSDVVCRGAISASAASRTPWRWCLMFRRSALAAVLPQFWVPREGISRDEYLTAKFGSVEAYKGIAGRVAAAAARGLIPPPARDAS
jgi:predicted DsbA family dithiol-disulfide isomerase